MKETEVSSLSYWIRFKFRHLPNLNLPTKPRDWLDLNVENLFGALKHKASEPFTPAHMAAFGSTLCAYLKFVFLRFPFSYIRSKWDQATFTVMVFLVERNVWSFVRHTYILWKLWGKIDVEAEKKENKNPSHIHK